MTGRWWWRLRAAALALLGLACGLLLLDHLFPPRLERARDVARQVLAADGSLLRAFPADDTRWRFPLTVEEVDPVLIDLLIAFEDRRFRWHPGVDPVALLRALGQALWHGRVVSGGSTLTMQTARLLEPRPRTLAAKGLEMLRALQLEWHFTKDEILGLYLTLAPMGGALEGVRAGSLAWFGREPRSLTLAEAGLLAALPQSPTRLRPDRAPAAAMAARNKLLDRVGRRLGLAEGELAAARATALDGRWHPLPLRAAHLAEALVAAGAPNPVLRTTIDAGLQAALERVMASHAEGLEPATSVAALVLEDGTGAIRAHLGGPDYFDARRSGMVDLTRAVRSPGSALKPFVYGLALDRLLIHPDTVIEDRPRRFGGYQPRNFHAGYAGQVTVREALQRSLNTPAVAVLDRVGPVVFDRALAAVGVELAFDRARLGPSLPLALGGAGLTLTDLARLYTAIPGAGRVAVPRALAPAPGDGREAAGEAPPLFGPVAAWYLRDILIGAPRPVGAMDPGADGAAEPIGFKTGTSYGFRDAWTVGFARGHVIAVWMGRPDGTPCAACTGIEVAAPLFFRIVALLPPPDRLAPPPPRPAGVIAGPLAALPPALARFDRPEAPAVARAAETGQPARAAVRPLGITFPTDGAALPLAPGRTLPLEAAGGRRPLTWLVNGRPLPAEARERRAHWQPDGLGFVTVEVIDADGRSAAARFRIEPWR